MIESEAKLTIFLRDWLATSEARLYDHVASTFRWLLATLFAANGGAIIGILSGSNKSTSAFRDGLIWFAIGLLLSIGMGIASAIVSLRFIGVIQRARIEIERVLAGEESDGSSIQEMVTRGQVTWKGFVPTYIGIGSFVCLIIGMCRVAGAL
jgi:hypothetical protein